MYGLEHIFMVPEFYCIFSFEFIWHFNKKTGKTTCGMIMHMSTKCLQNGFKVSRYLFRGNNSTICIYLPS